MINPYKWAIRQTFETGLMEDIIRWKKQGGGTSVMLNLSQYGIGGDYKEKTAGDIIESLMGHYLSDYGFYGLTPVKKSSPTNPKYKFWYLWWKGSGGFDEREKQRKEVQSKSEAFFIILETLGYDNVKMIKQFPSKWDVKENGRYGDRTLADLQKMRDYTISSNPERKDYVFFWTTDGSSKKLFSIAPQYYDKLENYLKRFNIKIRRLKGS